MGSLILPRFRVVIEIRGCLGEMDAFQHVNNVPYFRYFESARIAYFDRLDGARKSKGFADTIRRSASRLEC